MKFGLRRPKDPRLLIKILLVGSISLISFIVFYKLIDSHTSYFTPSYSTPPTLQTSSMKEFQDIAADEIFQGKWEIMEADTAARWTIRVRSYAQLFRFWETILEADEDGHPIVSEEEMNEISSTMNDINHRMFPWLKMFQSNPLSLKKSYVGKGLVMSVGDNQAKFAIISLKHVRYLGCSLPIEVYYDGENDLSPENRAKLQEIPDLTVINMHDIVNDDVGKISGWAMKPFALFISSFREAILMDADVVFLENPEIIFQEPAYKKGGTMFYKDRTMFEQNYMQLWIRSFLPPPYSSYLVQSRIWNGKSYHELESGVVVYDKHKRFLGLLATTLINVSKLRDWFYNFVWGDKETFWIGPEMIFEPYVVTSQSAGLIGPKPEPSEDGSEGKKSCSPQLLHSDESGNPLWFNQWIFENRFADIPAFEKLEFYALEPGKYELGSDNRCCLEVDGSNSYQPLSSRHLEVLEHIRNSWIEHYPK